MPEAVTALAETRQHMKPALSSPVVALAATASFRDRLRKGMVKRAADNKATVHLPLEVDDNHFIIRIPRNLSYSDLRTKDSFTDEAGKYHKESAMITVNTLGLKDCEYSMSFVDAENNTRLDMQVRPNVTLNLSCDYGTVKLFDAETGDALATAE